MPGGDWVFTGVDRQGAMFAAQSKKRVAPPPDREAREVTKTATKATNTKNTKKSRSQDHEEGREGYENGYAEEESRKETVAAAVDTGYNVPLLEVDNETSVTHRARTLRPSSRLSAQTKDRLGHVVQRQGPEQLQLIGTANWQIVDGAVQANMGTGYLVSKETYTDFEIKVEFWSSNGGNSGVYMRCMDGTKITDKTCYEANIFDKRTDQSGRTGGIPNYAPPIAIVDAEGKWNTYEITLRGPPHRRRAEWHEDGRRDGQHAEERPDRASVQGGGHQDPQRADSKALGDSRIAELPIGDCLIDWQSPIANYKCGNARTFAAQALIPPVISATRENPSRSSRLLAIEDR